MPPLDVLSVFQILLAALPVAAYLAFLAAVHSRSTPVLLPGRWDLTLLGLVFVPILFVSLDWRTLPERWPVFAAAGALLLFLLVLVGPQEFSSWVIYNARAADVRQALTTALADMGETVEQRGDELEVPGGRLRLSVSETPWLHNVTVYFAADRMSLADRLEAHLLDAVARMPSASRKAGLPYLAVCLATVGAAAALAVTHRSDLLVLIRRAYVGE
jgi:hypothetical protein